MSAAVWDLADLMLADGVEKLPASLLASCERVIRDGQIDLMQRPSARPGVYGHPGASPTQIDMISEFARHERRIFAACGANQCGKTSATATAFCRHLRDHARGGDCFWIIARTHQTLRDIPCKEIWRLIPRSRFESGAVYNPTTGFGNARTLRLRTADKGLAELWLWTEEMDLGVIESARLNGVWWTECRREAIFDALQPRLAARRGWLIMDYIPCEPWHRRLRLMASAMPDEVGWWHFTMAGNAHNLPHGEVERQRRTMSEQAWKLRGLGEEAMLEGLIYPQFSERRHVIPSFEVPASWPRWRFLDYGFAAPTAAGWATVAPIGWSGRDHETLIIYREHYQSRMTVGQHAAAIIAASAGESYIGDMLVDPAAWQHTAANEQSIAEQYEEAGIACEPWPRTNAFGEDAMVEIVRRLLEADRLLVFDSCVNTISEFQSWSYKRNRDGEIDPLEKYESRDNHMLDGIRGWAATMPTHSATGGGVEVIEERGGWIGPSKCDAVEGAPADDEVERTESTYMDDFDA